MGLLGVILSVLVALLRPAVAIQPAGGGWGALAAIGQGQSVCALDIAGRAWCWGRLVTANGTLDTFTTPQLLPGNMTWSQLAVGDAIVCGIAAVTDTGQEGSVYCWGVNVAGMIGAGITYTLTPTFRFQGPWANISVGSDSACAILKAGRTLFCWGDNQYGQLGNGNTDAVVEAIAVNPMTASWAQVTVGRSYACGRRVDNTLWCWGSNAYGQLGTSSVAVGSFSSLPVEVEGNNTWVNVMASDDYACGVKEDPLAGNLTGWCWGDLGGPVPYNISKFDPSNLVGTWQADITEDIICGINPKKEVLCLSTLLGTFLILDIPLNGSTVSEIQSGLDFQCLLTTMQDIYCWGNNSYGQVTGETYSLTVRSNVTEWFSPVHVVLPEWPPEALLSPSQATSIQPVTGGNSSSSSVSIGAIVGGVVGGVVAVAVALALFMKLRRRQQAKHSPEVSQGAQKGWSWNFRGQQSVQSDLTGSGKLDSGKSGSTQELPSPLSLSPSPPKDVRKAASFPVDLRTWLLDFKQLKMKKVIGEGSYGQVSLAVWREIEVAVKRLEIRASGLLDTEGQLSSSKPILDGLTKEAELLATLRHPNVLQFIGITTDPPAIVTEFCSQGSLSDVLRNARQNPVLAAELTWERRLSLALGAATGMLYLHTQSPPTLHRDLKGPNILVTSTWQAKVADFNLSQVLVETASMTGSTACPLNPRWLAPEIMEDERPSTASDVYGFGIVLWELLSWQVPWPGEILWAIVKAVRNGGRPSFPPPGQAPGADHGSYERIQEAYEGLMQRCWAQDPAVRPSFQEIVPELRHILGQLGSGA